MAEIKIEKEEKEDDYDRYDPYDLVTEIKVEDPKIESEYSEEFQETSNIKEEDVKELVQFEITEIPNPEIKHEDDSFFPELNVSVKSIVKCPYCPKQYGTKTAYRQHLRLIHPGFPSDCADGFIQCSICSKDFTELADLEQHVVINHPD
ncbi:hypothetical protein DMENIID0001_135550 [Sergentomyia squamirostris]